MVTSWREIVGRAACGLLAPCVMVAALSACAGAPDGQVDVAARSADREQAAVEIGRVLDDWHDAAARADEARYFGHFTPDAVFLGTDATARKSPRFHHGDTETRSFS